MRGHWGLSETENQTEKSSKTVQPQKLSQNRKPHTKPSKRINYPNDQNPSRPDGMVTSEAKE